jgi:folate-dependent phosphoribosylglycinamide formyltransferase PurN
LKKRYTFGFGAEKQLKMKQFNKLQQKWGVGAVQFWLIMLTFALGGSLSGYLNKQLLNLVFLEKNVAYWVFYPIVLTILWPFSVIFVSLATGQFRFFKGYLSRMLARLFGKGVAKPATSSTTNNTHYNNVAHNAVSRAAMPIHVAIFASGAGSNAKKIIEYFENQGVIKVSLIVCNVPGAGVLAIAAEKGIPTLIINKTEFSATGYISSLKNADIHFIVLAGFLWKVPEVLVNAYSKAIINIHPALLPNYGGKGMYGNRVHAAIIEAGEIESGITIHWVDAQYDEGDIIFQARCAVEPGETPETLANKIHALEHAHFAPTIEKLLLG